MKSGVGGEFSSCGSPALAAQAVNAFARSSRSRLKFDKIYEVYSQRFRREDLGDEEKFDPKVLPREYLVNPHRSVRLHRNHPAHGDQPVRRQAAFALGDEEPRRCRQVPIPIHAFDLIVADECHRATLGRAVGVAEHARPLRRHQGGLTRRRPPHKAYFSEWVYRYEYERAVREGTWSILTVCVKSNVRMARVLQEGEQVG